jgi:hypothetical protein
MMDATQLFPNGFHPVDINTNRNWKGKAKHTTRTKCSPRYYLIDFGLSRMHDPANGPPLEYPVHGGDKTAPEFQGYGYHVLQDPFPTDVYYLGNMIRREFIEVDLFYPSAKPSFNQLSPQGYDSVPGKYGLEFMQPLIADMVADDPTKRPTMAEVVVRFDEIRHSLSSWKLRARPIPHDELAIATFFLGIPHWYRRIRYVLRRIPPVPVL